MKEKATIMPRSQSLEALRGLKLDGWVEIFYAPTEYHTGTLPSAIHELWMPARYYKLER